MNHAGRSRKQDSKPGDQHNQADRAHYHATNVEIDKESIRDFEKLAKKYGVDFAVRKDKSVDPPRFLVFVRSKDADALDAICKEHQARALTKNEKPSVLAQLKKFKEIVAAIPKKVREKKQERDL